MGSLIGALFGGGGESGGKQEQSQRQEQTVINESYNTETINNLSMEEIAPILLIAGLAIFAIILLRR